MENNDNVKIMKSYYNILLKILIFTKKRKIFTIKTTFIQQIIIFSKWSKVSKKIVVPKILNIANSYCFTIIHLYKLMKSLYRKLMFTEKITISQFFEMSDSFHQYDSCKFLRMTSHTATNERQILVFCCFCAHSFQKILHLAF